MEQMTVLDPLPKRASRTSWSQITRGVPSAFDLVVHPVVGGERDHGAEIVQSSELLVHGPVVAIGFLLAGAYLCWT
jgi:hypothetical protein